jgi:hypothetical protein
MGCSVGRDALIRVQGVGRYMNTRTKCIIIRPCCASLAPVEPLILGSFCNSMADLFRARRSSSEDQHLLPASDSYRTTIASFMSISTLFAWTFGSGAVVCGRSNYHPYLPPNIVWAIVLEDMAGCVDAHALCHWYVYESSRLFPDVMIITEPGTSDHYCLAAH